MTLIYSVKLTQCGVRLTLMREAAENESVIYQFVIKFVSKSRNDNNVKS